MASIRGAEAVHALSRLVGVSRFFRVLVKDRKNQHLMLDSTIVRAHQQAAKAEKRGSDKALGRSRGGWTTKHHLLTG
jgi:hypothetical protein